MSLKQFNHLVYIISLLELERDMVAMAQKKVKDKGVRQGGGVYVF